MTKFLRLSAIFVLAAALMSANANAQEQKKDEPAKAAPAARAAPVARPAPAARAAPQRQAPQRAAAPQRAPQRAATPQQRQAPQRAAAPQRGPQRATAPQRQAPQRAAAPQRAPQKAATTAHKAAPRVVNRPAKAPARTATPAVRNVTPSAATPAASVKQSRAQLRSQQAQERKLRQQESRQLRALPASQRAQKQQEINQRRQLRAQQQQIPNARVQPNAAVQSNAPGLRATRRNGTARVTPQVARQGRFAAAFANREASANGQVHQRGLLVAAHRAWSRGQRAGFVSWYGPVFWPYAYSDVFDYAFWPNGYDDGFWAYAYDDFFDGVFWGERGAPQAYADAEVGPQVGPRATNAGVQELCTEPGSGITAWPFAQIQQKVGLSAEQKSLLGEVRGAATKASAVFKTSCPAQNAYPLTPPGRLQAMIIRLQATLEATQTVRPALEAFYNSLSDEQKERFNELGPKTAKVTTAQATTGQASADEAGSCKQPKEGLANLPIEKIEDVVKPTDAQEADLNALQDATTKAVSIMQAACPDETPLTPTGRLEAMQTRLQAMIDAAITVKPSLDSFYASLSSEQKARFNRIGQELAQSGG